MVSTDVLVCWKRGVRFGIGIGFDCIVSFNDSPIVNSNMDSTNTPSSHMDSAHVVCPPGGSAVTNAAVTTTHSRLVFDVLMSVNLSFIPSQFLMLRFQCLKFVKCPCDSSDC